MINKIFFFLALCLLPASLVAQKSPMDVAQSYYLEGKYSAAQDIYLNEFYSEADCQDKILYFIASCSKELSNSDSKYWYSLLIQEYSQSPYAELGKKDLAFIYFAEKEYLRSEILLSQISKTELKDDELYFKLAYSLFENNSLDDARYYFSKVTQTSRYKSLALYYYAHIAYIHNLYKTSLSNFQLLEDDKVFGNIVPYYIAQIYFHQKKYKDLIDYTVPVLEHVIPSREKEIHRFLAESYYQLSDFQNAEIYFKSYISLSENIQMIDYFQLGQINVFLEDYQEAIIYLEKIEDVSDSLSQYSSYYLGESYLQIGKKQFALQAFRKASNFDSDLHLTEESLYNYFKLSYELDLPYSNLTDVMNRMDQMHLTKYKSELNRLMINMFQSTNQYQEAFDFLKDNHLPKKEEQRTLQRLAYFIGVQHYNNGHYNRALLMFEYSRKYPENQEIEIMSIYWIADCYFQLRDYTKSINNYTLFLKTPSNFLLNKIGIAKYNLAYAYFQSDKYDIALEYFRKAIKDDLDASRENDAYLRMADCYYMMSDFINARKNYIKASNIGIFDTDYALYKQSKCSGLLSDYKNQEKILLKIEETYKGSSYFYRSLIDLANLYKNIDEGNKAITYYDKILDISGDNEILSSSILNKALIYFNRGENEKAITLLKKIILEYSQTKSFKVARIGLKDAYIKIQNIEEYLNFINTIPEINISVSSKDSLTYQVAYNNYKEGDYLRSQKGFQSYLSNFGQTAIFLVSSTFYLAESYWNTQDTMNAIKEYKEIVELGNTEYLERSLVILSRYAYDIKDYDFSNIYYQKLETMASNNSLKREAIIRLMFGFEESNVDLAAKYSEMVLKMDKADNRLLARAKIIIARSDFDSGNYTRSAALCDEIVDLTKNNDGSEALYMKAYFKYLEEDYGETEELIFLMAEQYSSNYWIAKGFILLSDVYLKSNNSYQAKAILESVIENHDSEDILNLAREKWEKIIKKDSDEIEVLDLEAIIIITDTLDYKINYDDLEIDIYD